MKPMLQSALPNFEAAEARSIDPDGEILAQRQFPFDQTVQKTVETPQLQCIDKVVGDPVDRSWREDSRKATVADVEKIEETIQTQRKSAPVCQNDTGGNWRGDRN